jgi:hypothetical protein
MRRAAQRFSPAFLVLAFAFGCEVEPPPDPPSSPWSSAPSEHAYVGVPYSYTVSVDRDRFEPGQVQLASGPSGMVLIENVLDWTPAAEDVGSHDVHVVVFLPDETLDLEYTIDVSPAALVGSLVATPAGGATISLAGTGTSYDGTTITVAPGAVETDTEISVFVVEEPLAPLPIGFEPVGPGIILMPAGVRGTVEVPIPTVLPELYLEEDVRLVQIVDGAMFEGEAGPGRTTVLSSEARAGAVRADIEFLGREGILRAVAARYETRTSAHFELFWPQERRPSGRTLVFVPIPERSASAILDSLEAAWTFDAGFGCPMPRTPVAVIASDYTDAVRAAGFGAFVYLDKIYLPRTDLAVAARVDVLAHELFHVVQYGYRPSSFETWPRWISEGSAEYVGMSYPGNPRPAELAPWGDVAGIGLPRATEQGGPSYRFALFYKHLHAQGGFDVCRLMDQTRSVSSQTAGVAALDSFVGGALVDRYIGFTAAYNLQRTNASITDISRITVGYTPPRGSIGASAPIWAATHSVAGGASFTAMLDRVSTVKVRADLGGAPFRARLFDQSFARIADLDSTRPETMVPASGRTALHLVIVPEMLGGAVPRTASARFEACSNPECTRMCPSVGQPCVTRSECCPAEECVVDRCVNCAGKRRVGESCAAGSECCGLLICAPQSASTTECCLRATDRCTSDAECCGEMRCSAGYCRCQERGERCFRGHECCGGMFCSGGVCT